MMRMLGFSWAIADVAKAITATQMIARLVANLVLLFYELRFSSGKMRATACHKPGELDIKAR